MTEGKLYNIDTDLVCKIRKPYLEKIKQLEKSRDRYKELYYQQVDKYNELWDAIPDEVAEKLLKLMEKNKND